MPTEFQLDAVIKTGHRTYRVLLDTSPPLALQLRDRALRDVPCADPTFSYRIARRAVAVTVPRSCIGQPIRVRGGAALSTDNGDANLFSFYEDDALRRGVSLIHLPRTGPWVRSP